MDRSILIVTSERDGHADAVAGLLRRRGVNPVFLYPGGLASAGTVHADVAGGLSAGRFGTRGETVEWDTIRAVWWRKPGPFVVTGVADASQRQFAETQTAAAMSEAWGMLAEDPGRFWLSHPTNIGRASVKLEQMQRAALMGFQVPKTLVSNDAEQVRAFYEECDRQIIYKCLAFPLHVPVVIPTGDDGRPLRDTAPMQYTAAVTDVHLQDVASVTSAPGLFQELVRKRLELRVTVIDGQVFTCGIHSQSDARTQFDWRHHHVQVPWSAETIPQELADKCVALTRSYGLAFGAFDFIVTPDGEHIFLEMNPNGQFLFVQDMVPELRLAQAVVDTLIRHASGDASPRSGEGHAEPLTPGDREPAVAGMQVYR